MLFQRIDTSRDVLIQYRGKVIRCTVISFDVETACYLCKSENRTIQVPFFDVRQMLTITQTQQKRNAKNIDYYKRLYLDRIHNELQDGKRLKK